MLKLTVDKLAELLGDALVEADPDPRPLSLESKTLDQWSRTSLSQAEALDNLESSLSPEKVQSYTLRRLAGIVVDTLHASGTSLR
jgi:hypothetical protein